MTEKKKLKIEFIKILKNDILKCYDGFGWYQKTNLLCDDMNYTDTMNMIYHNSLSDDNYVKLVDCVLKSRHAWLLKDDKFYRAAEMIKWQSLNK